MCCTTGDLTCGTLNEAAISGDTGAGLNDDDDDDDEKEDDEEEF